MNEKIKRLPHMCLTCEHFEPYHCLLNDGYIGIDYDKPTKCRAWQLNEKYKNEDA